MKKRRRMERSKKVGSRIDDDKDVEKRKQLATVVFNKLKNFWTKDNKLKTSSKNNYKNSFNGEINSITSELTLTKEERLNAYHRKQLKIDPQH